MQRSKDNGCNSPKRVAGGIGVVMKKKRKRPHPSSHDRSDRSDNSMVSVPSVLSSLPDNSRVLSSKAREQTKRPKEYDNEFGDDSHLLEASNGMTNDTLLCLQAYTQPKNGMASESCAYCPIFTVSNVPVEAETKRRCSTHAAPFLPKQVLIDISSNHEQTNADLRRLASENKIRLLQLHGTAIAMNGLGWKGDGNDDEDVAVMETCAYEVASKMALDAHFNSTVKAEPIYIWFSTCILSNFTGKTWIRALSLETFIESFAKKRGKYVEVNSSSSSSWTIAQMKSMTKELIDAGLLLPRRGLGLNGGEGYWFSLPGLGKAAKSIADGRLSILRRIRSSKFKEKKRSALEQEIGRPINTPNGLGSMKDRNAHYSQSGKFLLLDLLSKNMICIHETCTGDHFVRIKE